MFSNKNQEQLINILNIPSKKLPSYSTIRRVMMGVFESEIQLIFDEIRSANNIAIRFYSWQKSHCFLGNREQGIENR